MTASGVRGVLEHLRGSRRTLSAAAVISVLAAGAMLVQPLLINNLLGDAQAGRPMDVVIIVAVIGLVFSATLLSGFKEYLVHSGAEAVAAAARRRLVHAIFSARPEDVDEQNVGDIVSRGTADVNLVKQFVARGLADVPGNVLTCLVCFIALCVVDPITFGVTMAAILGSAIITVVSSKVLQSRVTAGQEALSRFGDLLASRMATLRLIASYNGRSRVKRDLDEGTERVRRLGRRAAKVRAVVGPANQGAFQIALILVAAVSGARVVRGEIEVADVVTFVLYFGIVVAPAASLANFVGAFFEALGAQERLVEVYRIGPEERSGRGFVGTGPVGVVFDDVAVAIRGNEVLRGLSFEARPGEVTVLVGRSGAGKSTVLNVIEGFVQCTGGRVLIDGDDLRSLEIESWRAAISYVDQDSSILAGTLRDNLLPDGGELDVQTAEALLEGLGLGAWYRGLPDGLDSDVAGMHGRLSGGERQRVAIARALLRKPSLLLLDEHLSALDAQVEAEVIRTIREFGGSMTTIAVTHDLGAAAEADHVVDVLSVDGVRNGARR